MGGDFRVVAAETTFSIETARLRRDLAPVAAVALGRALTGAVLLARLLDKHVRKQYTTLRFDGGGPLGLLLAEATIAGHVRGYVENPLVEMDQLQVGDALGTDGMLTVVRGAPPEGKPYTSQVRLANGEIATDIAHYLAASEQIASGVLLGVLIKPAGVAAAGGLIVQAFPHASAASIQKMEAAIADAPSISTLLANVSLEDAVADIFSGLGYKSLGSDMDIPVSYHCTCTRERAIEKFSFFSRQELAQMIEQDGGAEAVCQFCGMKYQFDPDELLALPREPDA